MKSLFKYGAVASVFLLTAAPMALAQNYNPGGSSGWNQSGTQGERWNQGSQGWNQSGAQGSGWNQNQGWKQGGYSGSSQSSNQGMNNEPSQQDAYQELSKYGFNNVRNLQRSGGWEAHATKNGDRVHVFIDDDGMIATYRGD